MIIRKATIKDANILLSLGKRLHDESEYSVLSFNDDKALEHIKFMLDDENHAVFVADYHGDIIGMLCAECSTMYFSDEKVAGEHMIFVVPEMRGSTAFSRMVSEFATWASDNGSKILYLRTTSGINAKEVDNIYHRLGFDRVGGIYRRFL
jgi:GNAT superfamily N-acetyltransferase